MVATTNGALKTQLETWTTALEAARSMEVASKGRGEAITAFCRTFVPPDVGEDEILAFSGQLGEDEEFFNSFCREIKQCASGDRVEKITGDQSCLHFAARGRLGNRDRHRSGGGLHLSRWQLVRRGVIVETKSGLL